MKIDLQRLLLCGLVITIFAQLNPAQVRWFDQYSNVTRVEEEFHLNNFAYYLQKDPDLIGYIAFKVGKNEKTSAVARRAERNKQYLFRKFNIPKKRIRLVCLGRADETLFILQPLIRDRPFPN